MTVLTSFQPILDRAVARKGGVAALNKLLPKAKSAAALRKIPDDRWLAEMTRRVFQAGFVWRIIEHKWPGFEEVFIGFDPTVIYYWSDEHLERVASDARIVRNFQKVRTVRDNAAFVVEISEKHGSFGRWVAAWPADDIVGLWHELKLGGSRLGGMSGSMMLRAMGKDSFILTADVAAALNAHNVITSSNPTSQRDLRTVQTAFNTWSDETGRSLSELSRILAYSLGAD